MMPRAVPLTSLMLITLSLITASEARQEDNQNFDGFFRYQRGYDQRSFGGYDQRSSGGYEARFPRDNGEGYRRVNDERPRRRAEPRAQRDDEDQSARRIRREGDTPRHRIKDAHRNRDDNDTVRTRGATVSGTRTLTPIIEQLVRDCSQEILDLKSFPLELIAQTIKPDEKQKNALEDIRQLANKLADTLETNCPTEIPVEPLDRLEAVDHGIEVVEGVVSILQPPMQAFYDLLSAEQKARLASRTILASGDTSRAAAIPGPLPRSRNDAVADRGAAPVPQVWDCAQWGAELRAWPVAKVEQLVPVWPRQRATFYEMMASFQRAADAVADICPSEPALTPIDKLAQMRKQLEAVRRSVAMIRPTLSRFDKMLDGGQRKRFRDAI